ncbi:hypothetical protein [Clostridium baratii]
MEIYNAWPIADSLYMIAKTLLFSMPIIIILIVILILKINKVIKK